MSELPKGWVEAPLEDLCLSVSDGDHQAPAKAASGIPFITISSIGNGKINLADVSRFVPATYQQSLDQNRKPKKGDILLSVAGSIGRAAIVDDPNFVFQRHIALIRANGVTDRKYIYYFLLNPDTQHQLQDSATGTAQKTLPLTKLRSVGTPLPPLAEQKRIVAKLDALGVRSARARKELERIDALVARYKQAVLSKAFSGDLTKDWRKQCHDGTPIEPLNSKLPDDREGIFQQTTRRDLPSNWRSLKLGQLGKVLGGGTPNKTEPSYWGGPIPWVTPKDMKVDQIASSIETITEAGLKESSAKLVPEESLLFVVRGMILAHSFPVAINKRTVTVNQDMKALTPLTNLLPEYLLFGLKSLKDIVVQLAGSATHGTKRLESGVILNIAIPVAPSTEQREIVRRIESAFDKIDRLAGEAKRALALVGRLDEAVLAKAFRGELVPQDPNDEPASVLLERIRAERAAAPKPKRGRRTAAQAG